VPVSGKIFSTARSVRFCGSGGIDLSPLGRPVSVHRSVEPRPPPAQHEPKARPIAPSGGPTRGPAQLSGSMVFRWISGTGDGAASDAPRAWAGIAPAPRGSRFPRWSWGGPTSERGVAEDQSRAWRSTAAHRRLGTWRAVGPAALRGNGGWGVTCSGAAALRMCSVSAGPTAYHPGTYWGRSPRGRGWTRRPVGCSHPPRLALSWTRKRGHWFNPTIRCPSTTSAETAAWPHCFPPRAHSVASNRAHASAEW